MIFHTGRINLYSRYTRLLRRLRMATAGFDFTVLNLHACRPFAVVYSHRLPLSFRSFRVVRFRPLRQTNYRLACRPFIIVSDGSLKSWRFPLPPPPGEKFVFERAAPLRGEIQLKYWRFVHAPRRPPLARDIICTRNRLSWAVITSTSEIVEISQSICLKSSSRRLCLSTGSIWLRRHCVIVTGFAASSLVFRRQTEYTINLQTSVYKITVLSSFVLFVVYSDNALVRYYV